MKFNFKSTGFKVDNDRFKVSEQQKQSLQKPIGIKTPVQFGSKQTKLFEMHYNPIDVIKDNLRNLVKTNSGERLGRYNYGCNLSALLFERGALNNNFENLASNLIIKQIERYMPIVQIDDITINAESKKLNDNTSLARVIINLSFSIPRARITDQLLQIVMYVGG